MKVFSDSLRQLEQVMDSARTRQGVLASNVTNIDTPGYRAQDVEAPLFDTAMRAVMSRSDAAHMSAPGQGSGEVTQADDRAPREDGNTVSLERQMAKLEENKIRYGAASSIISRRMALLRYAVTDGNG